VLKRILAIRIVILYVYSVVYIYVWREGLDPTKP
jgi:hypothetical protein